MTKYKRKLVADIEIQKAEEKIQFDLKDKYNIQDPDVVVVEKSNMIKFLIRLITSLLRLLCILTVFGLAVCGLLALVYPEPRTALIQVLYTIFKQLFSMLSF